MSSYKVNKLSAWKIQFRGVRRGAQFNLKGHGARTVTTEFFMQKDSYLLFRIVIMISIVIIILLLRVTFVNYKTLTFAEEYFENCDRECHELDWPMICRVKLVVEVYKTLSK